LVKGWKNKTAVYSLFISIPGQAAARIYAKNIEISIKYLRFSQMTAFRFQVIMPLTWHSSF